MTAGRGGQAFSGGPGLLIVFGGLPGTGKTTVSRALARRLAATYLRIDAIEQAIRDAGVTATQLGAAGYAAAQAVAAGNLAQGRVVVADCVNPVLASREGWRSVAHASGARLLEVEIVCSDVSVHKQRLRERTVDIAGLPAVTWEDLALIGYEPWDRPQLVVDTASLSPADAVNDVLAFIEGTPTSVTPLS